MSDDPPWDYLNNRPLSERVYRDRVDPVEDCYRVSAEIATRIGGGDLRKGYVKLDQAVRELLGLDGSHWAAWNKRLDADTNPGPSFSPEEWLKLNSGETTGFTRVHAEESEPPPRKRKDRIVMRMRRALLNEWRTLPRIIAYYAVAGVTRRVAAHCASHRFSTTLTKKARLSCQP